MPTVKSSDIAARFRTSCPCERFAEKFVQKYVHFAVGSTQTKTSSS